MIGMVAAIAMAGIVAKGLGVIAIIFAVGVLVGIILTVSVAGRIGTRRKR